MDWAKLLLGCVGLLSQLMTWAREKQLLDAGAQQAIAEALRAQLKEVDAANAARARVRSVIVDGKLPENYRDAFRRD